MRNFRSSVPCRAFVVAAAIATAAIVVSGAAGKPGDGDWHKLDKIQHIVVIYEENHSFDNLYGGWERVRGLGDADAAHTTQLGQTSGTTFAPFECLYMDDVNLQAQSAANPSAPLSDTCDNTTGGSFPSHFQNAPFRIDDYLGPNDTTCPPNPLQAFARSNGWIKGSWQKTENNRDAKYYAITRAGTRALEKQTDRWNRLAGLVNKLLVDEQ